MGKPRLLDLFCGAGGAAMGYHRAGFEVVGVDIKPQPHYPFTFVQADATSAVALGDVGIYPPGFDAIHASPPCQAFTALKAMPNAKDHPDLLTPTRDLLNAIGLPYAIENVEGAPMTNHVVLCGSMFGLGTGAAELRRHRWFELNPPCGALLPPCSHGLREQVIGVYGGGGKDNRRLRPRPVGVYGSAVGRSVRDGTQQFSTAERAEAMGIDWMTGAELSQAIPPAYTEWIGAHLLAAIKAAA